MPVIFTLTFNPCIDVNTKVDAMAPEIKLRCTEPLIQPGGGGINVARAITMLGGHAVALFPCGGETGSQLKDLLTGERVSFISEEISGSTRENLIVTDTSTGLQYRFTMPGPVLNEAACKGLLSVLDHQPQLDYLVISGSLSKGVPLDIFGQLTAIAYRKKAMLVVDIAGEALKKAVECGAHLIKVSRHELASFAGVKELPSMEEIETAANRLLAHGSRAVIVSMGASGAVCVSDGYSVRIDAPPTQPVSTVGAGDSMVAGIVWQLAQGRPLSQALEYGVACGTAATMHPGTSLCKKEDVEELLAKMKNISSGHIHQKSYAEL
ncbi:1-phosphofructokinase family hexose kinase [Flavitalea sp. BT771]|uniref:1-phosphofructokinase family hexose kinase n=1 Tax=Flavitalea sp. BT771 TaxID=3063329 RepID=UPI0026E1A1E6|nr:1-phosphofructokinase family hexose kinase [Flavitalea sp. BT771]MDO6429488.1 1-phosphofructokinase family hexose kinase [Flavitalea sp. BT771]MDV6218384.1 1-phosphofructokinase family hexose kinase [Flavitalea sp. BT771]